jgi:hypothetical protein
MRKATVDASLELAWVWIRRARGASTAGTAIAIVHQAVAQQVGCTDTAAQSQQKCAISALHAFEVENELHAARGFVLNL